MVINTAVNYRNPESERYEVTVSEEVLTQGMITINGRESRIADWRKTVVAKFATYAEATNFAKNYRMI